MSYEIVKSIVVRDGKVIIKSDSNNVRPRDFHEWECSTLTSLYQRSGREALDIEILKCYENGTFQEGNKNRYTRALEVLRHMPEYEEFNWRNGDWKETHERRKLAEFENLLKKAMYSRKPRNKFIIQKNYFGKTVYLFSARQTAKWTYEIKKAKVFRWLEDATGTRACYRNSEDWEVKFLNGREDGGQNQTS